MPLRRWERQHGDKVARVEPTADQRWLASVWAGSRQIANGWQQFDELRDAQSNADHLIRVTFQHECTPLTCSAWQSADERRDRTSKKHA